MSQLTDESFQAHALEVAERDPALGAVVAEYGIPAFWHRPATFATLVLLIVEQQVSLASAKAVFDRMVAAIGSMSPAAVLGAHDGVLPATGITRQKLRYVQLLAAAVAEGTFDLAGLAGQDDDDARTQLLALVGVGPWTAECYLLSALRRPDVWPVGDRALQVGVGEVLGLAEIPTSAELEAIGERWRPLRAVAARLVWHAYLCRRGRAETEIAGLA
ncbi:MAG: DNA-3-methyladenine glycosylase family protein [Acidimicrobiales bacterium]